MILLDQSLVCYLFGRMLDISTQSYNRNPLDSSGWNIHLAGRELLWYQGCN